MPDFSNPRLARVSLNEQVAELDAIHQACLSFEQERDVRIGELIDDDFSLQKHAPFTEALIELETKITGYMDCHSFARATLALAGIDLPLFKDKLPEELVYGELLGEKEHLERYKQIVNFKNEQLASDPELESAISHVNPVFYTMAKEHGKIHHDNLRKSIVQEVLSGSSVSRYLYFFRADELGSSAEEFNSVHSAVILGATLAEDNLWILQVHSMGRRPSVVTLSTALIDLEHMEQSKGVTQAEISNLKAATLRCNRYTSLDSVAAEAATFESK